MMLLGAFFISLLLAAGLAFLIVSLEFLSAFFLQFLFFFLFGRQGCIPEIRRDEIADEIEVYVDLLRAGLAALDRSLMHHDLIHKLMDDGRSQIVEGLIVVKEISEYSGRSTLYNQLILNGTLHAHIVEVNERCTNMKLTLVAETAKQRGGTEELKGRDQLAWVGMMNNIDSGMEELILSEYVYC